MIPIHIFGLQQIMTAVRRGINFLAGDVTAYRVNFNCDDLVNRMFFTGSPHNGLKGDCLTVTNFQLNDDQKVQVLLSQLQERYCASHNMRERSTQCVLWISGLAIGLAWLLISQSGITIMQRFALTLLIAALSIGSLIFMRGLQNGFKNNRNAMIACERSLNMHTPGAYMTDESLLSEAYADNNRRWSDHFNTLIILLSIVILSLGILTWTCPQTPAENQQSVQIHEKKEQ
jgi:hypothetical protein